MIRFEDPAGGRTYKIYFSHGECFVADLIDEWGMKFSKGVALNSRRRYTTCTIRTEEGSRLVERISICNPVDTFCKSTGRIRALTDALTTLSLSVCGGFQSVNRKNLRRVAWMAYFEACKT